MWKWSMYKALLYTQGTRFYVQHFKSCTNRKKRRSYQHGYKLLRAVFALFSSFFSETTEKTNSIRTNVYYSF